VEEMRKDQMNMLAMQWPLRTIVAMTPWMITCSNPPDRLIRGYGYILTAIYKWRKKVGASGTAITDEIAAKQVRGYHSTECCRAVEVYYLERAQKRT
jgi:hypothetical protein